MYLIIYTVSLRASLKAIVFSSFIVPSDDNCGSYLSGVQGIKMKDHCKDWSPTPI